MEYQRLTIRDNIGCFKYDLKDFKHKIGEFGDYDAFFAYSMAVKRLGELEDKIEAGTLVPKYSVVESGNTYCACMVDTNKLLVIGEYETKAEAEKRLEEIKNETKSIDNSEK